MYTIYLYDPHTATTSTPSLVELQSAFEHMANKDVRFVKVGGLEKLIVDYRKGDKPFQLIVQRQTESQYR